MNDHPLVEEWKSPEGTGRILQCQNETCKRRIYLAPTEDPAFTILHPGDVMINHVWSTSPDGVTMGADLR